MGLYFIRRVGQGLVTLCIVTMLVFGLTYASGNPAAGMIHPDADAEELARVERALGLDQPVYVQWYRFVQRAVRGDFGTSLHWRGHSAMGLVLSRFGATLRLGGLSLIVSASLAVPLGVISATRRDTVYDRIGKGFALLGQSLAPFWLGIILIWFVSIYLRWLPMSGIGDGSLRYYVLPVVTLSWYQVAAIMRLTRSALIDALDSEYVKLARMKGVAEAKVVWVHALKNAILVPLTYFGLIVGSTLTRTVVIEVVFNWPGTGTLMMTAVRHRDFPLINAAVMVFVVVFILANFAIDILYGVIDPRIRR